MSQLDNKKFQNSEHNVIWILGSTTGSKISQKTDKTLLPSKTWSIKCLVNSVHKIKHKNNKGSNSFLYNSASTTHDV